MKTNPLLMTDFYKIVHYQSYVKGLEYLYSYWTPRKSRLQGIDRVVVFGIQYILKELLVKNFEEYFFEKSFEELEAEYKRIIGNTMKDFDTTQSIEAMRKLHNLGYLPIRIKAITEGERVNIGVPMFEISNTVKGFGWLVNYLETYISNNIWHPMTSATIAYQYRSIVNHYYNKTSDNIANKKYAMGDFSMRGMTSFETSMASSAGHLLSLAPTATIPSILWLEEYYNSDLESELIGVGTASMEHSVMSSYTQENEFEAYRHLISRVFPSGKLSIVSDTYDYFRVLTEYFPKLKNDILKRQGTILIRGDSGEPIHIIAGYKYLTVDNLKFNHLPYAEYEYIYCTQTKKVYKPHQTSKHELMLIEDVITLNELKGTVEILWEQFGGEVNSKGYKVLDPHIRTIYGDSITLERAEEIYRRLTEKGFSVENAVLGIGSYTYQYVTRDTFGFALKATHAVVFNEERQIFKDPKTDTGNFKKSQRGLIAVFRTEDGFKYVDNLSIAQQKKFEKENELKIVFEDGVILKETSLKEIRNILHQGEF